MRQIDSRSYGGDTASGPAKIRAANKIHFARQAAEARDKERARAAYLAEVARPLKVRK